MVDDQKGLTDRMSQDSNKDPTKETPDDQKSPSNDHEDSAQTPYQINYNQDSETDELNDNPPELEPPDQIAYDQGFKYARQHFPHELAMHLQPERLMIILLRPTRRIEELFFEGIDPYHPENHPEIRRHLIDEPREFVTVNVGQQDEYLLPLWTHPIRINFRRRATLITDGRGVYLIRPSQVEHGEVDYAVRYLRPGRIHYVEGDWFDGFTRLVSPDRLESVIHELVNQRDRYERQQRLQQQQVQEVGGVEQSNQKSDEPSDSQEAQASDKQIEGEGNQQN